MNALLIEETEDNFYGEFVPPSKVVEAGDPRSKTWTAASFTAGRSVSTAIWTAEPGILKVRSYPVDEESCQEKLKSRTKMVVLFMWDRDKAACCVRGGRVCFTLLSRRASAL